MKSATLTQIMSLGDVKEAQVKAYLSYYVKQSGGKNLTEIQQRTTKYAQSLADAFICENKEFFDVRQNRIEFCNVMRRLRADQPYSGYRFWECAYKNVVGYEKGMEL